MGKMKYSKPVKFSRPKGAGATPKSLRRSADSFAKGAAGRIKKFSKSVGI